MNRIAIIGWGSLIWDLDDLAPHITGDWHMSGGPRLPMEFSRVSPKRKQALVVCLDPDHGVECATHTIASGRANLAETVRDLAKRERAPADRIGYASADGRSFGRMPEVCGAVANWCAANDWAGAVWTDLEPNFQVETDTAFSIASGTEYLRGLGPASLAEAVTYINSAPHTTRTPLRESLNADPWWQGLR